VTGPEEHVYRAQVGRRLHLRRLWLGLSQQDVAEKAGVSRNFISAIERGTQGLDAWRLGLAAAAIGVTLCWPLSGPDDQLTAPNRTADTPGRPGEPSRAPAGI
jgi:transcriptional regulator with XRE-family HTH domain